MTTSRTARKVVGAVTAAVVSVLLIGGVAGTASTEDAGRGIQTSTRS